MPSIQGATLIEALANLDPDVQITLTVRVGDLRGALQARSGGPQVLDAEQAAQWIGRTPEYWRRAAKAGKVQGAWQDAERGRWHLPRSACEQHLAAAQQRHGRRSTASVIPFDGAARARGPRKSA